MKVLIASGGSGGHIFPAISLAKELEKEGAEIIFVASRRRLDKSILSDAPYKKIFLSANPMPYKAGIGVVPFWFKLICDSVYALFILIIFRPGIVVGFGGYTAGAIVLLASLLGFKTIIHEQNVVPGRTNAFLDKRVTGVAVSFDETKKYFKNKNIIFTGNPLRAESLKECRPGAFAHLGLDESKIIILVMGGSQGAASLNKLVLKSMILLPKEKKEKLQVLHIAGERNADELKKRYSENGINSKVFGFIKNINEAYSVSDMAVSRSGAAAIFELAAFKKPMILIPYPNPRNNQRFNAQFFEKEGAAICKDEKTVTADDLEGTILELMENPDKRKALSENASKLSVTDGARRLKELVLNVK